MTAEGVGDLGNQGPLGFLEILLPGRMHREELLLQVAEVPTGLEGRLAPVDQALADRKEAPGRGRAGKPFVRGTADGSTVALVVQVVGEEQRLVQLGGAVGRIRSEALRHEQHQLVEPGGLLRPHRRNTAP